MFSEMCKLMGTALVQDRLRVRIWSVQYKPQCLIQQISEGYMRLQCLCRRSSGSQSGGTLTEHTRHRNMPESHRVMDCVCKGKHAHMPIAASKSVCMPLFITSTLKTCLRLLCVHIGVLFEISSLKAPCANEEAEGAHYELGHKTNIPNVHVNTSLSVFFVTKPCGSGFCCGPYGFVFLIRVTSVWVTAPSLDILMPTSNKRKPHYSLREMKDVL